MQNNLNDLATLLDLESIESNLFRGNSPNPGLQPVYGGQLLGQSMVAAGRTVDCRVLHSIHSHFIHPGDPHTPIFYKVEALRDSRRYSTRRVTASQHRNVVCASMLSFHAGEHSDFDHQETPPSVPQPEMLTAKELAGQRIFRDLPERIRRWYEPERSIELPHPPIELRGIEIGHYVGQKISDGCLSFWFRITEKLPDDPAMHVCALAYASDWSLLDAVLARYGRTIFDGRIVGASLDHAMWFHRPMRTDEWLLYTEDSPSAQSGRGLARGLIFKRDGTLVASVAQEASIRERR